MKDGSLRQFSGEDRLGKIIPADAPPPLYTADIASSLSLIPKLVLLTPGSFSRATAN